MIDSAPKIKTTLKRVGKWLLVALIVGVVAWAAVVRPFLVRQEKQRFESAAASLGQLAEEIQAKIGPADEIIQDNSCGRANLKSERGPLLCDVSYNLIYEDIDLPQANQQLENVSLFGKNLRPGSPNVEHLAFTLNENKRTPQVIYQDLSDMFGLSCNISFSYPVSNNFSESDKARFSAKSVFATNISCGKPALAEHFPLRN